MNNHVLYNTKKNEVKNNRFCLSFVDIHILYTSNAKIIIKAIMKYTLFADLRNDLSKITNIFNVTRSNTVISYQLY